MTFLIFVGFFLAYLFLKDQSENQKRQLDAIEQLSKQIPTSNSQSEQLWYSIGAAYGEEELEVLVCPKERWYSFCDDEMTEYHFEYKITGEHDVLVRLLFFTDNFQKVVADGVIIEDAFRKAYGDDSHVYPRDALTKLINWHSIDVPAMKYLLLSLHPEMIPHSDLRQQIRSELETFKTQLAKLKDHLTNLGGTFESRDGRLIFKLSGNSVEDEKVMVDTCKQFNLNFFEVIQSKEHIEKLEGALSRIPPKPKSEDD